MFLFRVKTPSTACSLRFLLVSLCGEDSCHDEYLIIFRTAELQSATKTFNTQDIWGIFNQSRKTRNWVSWCCWIKLKTWNLTWWSHSALISSLVYLCNDTYLPVRKLRTVRLKMLLQKPKPKSLYFNYCYLLLQFEHWTKSKVKTSKLG